MQIELRLFSNGDTQTWPLAEQLLKTLRFTKSKPKFVAWINSGRRQLSPQLVKAASLHSNGSVAFTI